MKIKQLLITFIGLILLSLININRIILDVMEGSTLGDLNRMIILVYEFKLFVFTILLTLLYLFVDFSKTTIKNGGIILGLVMIYKIFGFVIHIVFK